MKFGKLLRGSALIVAGLLAGCQSEENWTFYSPGPASTTTAAGVDAGETMVVHVPEMHCPFACWPAVEETLAAQPGVLDVELAPQKDENAIDNPKVFVRVSEDFDADAAMQNLATAGFKDSDVAAAN